MVDHLLRSNMRVARSRWKCELNQFAFEFLKILTNRFQFSVAEGDLIWLERGWYVTHTGLIRLANRRRCRGIEVHPISEFSDPPNRRYALKATVYKSKTCP